MKYALIFTGTFLAILTAMTFLVLQFQPPPNSLALADSTAIDSLASDSLKADSLLQELQAKAALDSLLERQKFLIDSLQNALGEKSRQSEQFAVEKSRYQEMLEEKQNLAFEQKTKQMAKIYEKMKPEEAAAIIAKLDSKVAISIISKMKKRQAARVMEALDPQKAVLLSKKMAQL